MIREWPGIAYMMVNMGYPITSALRDAMDESKFQQVLNLFEKKPNNDDLKVPDEQGRNLWHLFAENCPTYKTDILKELYDELVLREVDPRVLDDS